MDGVIVLGAGVAGLGCARDLPGGVVFEAAPHPGGHAFSHEMGGVYFDEGAHICHSRNEAFVDLLRQSAGEVVEVARSIVRNHWRGRWLTYPVQNHLHELPLEERVRALTDLVESHLGGGEGDPANYKAWCLRQYGRFLTETFYDDFTAKYWRTPAESLSTDWLGGRVMPSMLSRIIRGAFGEAPDSQAVFACFRYPARGGFFRFFSGLYDGLDVRCDERAVEVDTRRKTVRFASGRSERYDFLASSIPLPDLVGILHEAPASVRDLATRLRSTQLLCVNLIVNRPVLTDAHWFYVYGKDVEAARVSVPSNLAPGSAASGQTALQAEIFRRDDEPMDADELAERTTAQLGCLLGFDASEVHRAGHIHSRRAYVVSDHQRAGAVDGLLDWLEDRDIFSMGLYGRWRYVWSDQAFEQGRQAAAKIRARRGMSAHAQTEGTSSR